jgi:hypothetical protein
MAVLPADVESRKKTLIEVTQLILLVRCPGATILNDRPLNPPDAPYNVQLLLLVRCPGTKILNDRPITPPDAPYKPIECATYAPDH